MSEKPQTDAEPCVIVFQDAGLEIDLWDISVKAAEQIGVRKLTIKERERITRKLVSDAMAEAVERKRLGISLTKGAHG